MRLLVSIVFFSLLGEGGCVVNKCLNQLTKPYAHCIPSLPTLFLLPFLSLEVGGCRMEINIEEIQLTLFLSFSCSFFLFFWCGSGSGGIWLSSFYYLLSF